MARSSVLAWPWFCATLLALATGCSSDSTAKPQPPARVASAPANALNLLLLTLDTTRADALGCYGGDARNSPNLDRLAAEGTLFLSAFSQSNITNPTHLTLMTGLTSFEHGIFGVRRRIPDGMDTIPQAFERRDYVNAMFVSVQHLFDLDWLGFETRECLAVGRDEAIAEEVTDSVIDWLDQPRDRPFFVWAHYFDPHFPYDPPRDVRKMYYSGDAEARRAARRRGERANLRKHRSRRDVDYWRAMYFGEVHYMDREIGRLLGHLAEKKLADRTVVIAVADHGESIDEHEIFYDHVGLYEPQLRIPLIIHVPDMPGGQRRSERVTQVDVAATIVDLFGLPLEARGAAAGGKTRSIETAGISLAPLLGGGQSAALSARETLLHESAQNRQVAVRWGDYKLIMPVTRDNPHINPPLPGKPELFNLKEDPAETKNLVGEYPDIVLELRMTAEAWLKRGLVTDRPPKTAQERDRMKRLGYLQE